MHLRGLLLLVFGSTVVLASEWSYAGVHGPGKWKNMHGNEACGGNSQSPVNIPTSAPKSSSTGRIKFSYTVPMGMILKNNGHSAQVDLEDKQSWISGGGLKGTYIATQFHFHWGSSSDKGSEHTIDGKQYPLEMHIVHYLSNYTDFATAKDKSEGLAVVAILFEISASDNYYMGQVIKELGSIPYKGDSISLVPFNPLHLLPEPLVEFYSYDGSLTTPPCYESVKWRVIHKKTPFQRTSVRKKITLELKLNAFRWLRAKERGHGGVKIVDNFRPTQPLNGRTVYKVEAKY